jgi:hypothetical protein
MSQASHNLMACQIALREPSWALQLSCSAMPLALI